MLVKKYFPWETLELRLYITSSKTQLLEVGSFQLYEI